MRLSQKYRFLLVFCSVLFLLTGCAIRRGEETPLPTAVSEPNAAEANTETSPSPPEAEVAEAAEPTEEPTEEPTPTAIPAPTYTAVFEDAACEFDPLPGFDPECGFLIVPEDRGQPDGNQVRLHVAIFRSESSNPAPDPVIYLEGGPGGDALERLQFVFEDDFAPFLADRDLILFDQRGTGYSEPGLSCQEITDLTLDTLDENFSDEEGTALSLEALDACQQRLQAEGINLNAYNTVANAADVNDLRLALGIDQWNLYGISYGTRLALITMRDHPEGVRSVILDSAFPPQVNLSTDLITNSERAFDTLFAGCEASTDCATAYPDLESRFFTLVDSLEANPAKISVSDFFKGDRYDALVDGDALYSVIFQGLYSDEIIPLLPKLITDVESGNFTLLELLISNDISTQDWFSIGMYFSVICHDEVSFETLDEVEASIAAVPELAQFFEDTDANFEICALWQSGEGEAAEDLPVMSDIPTLVMAGEYDPITPPSWGELAAETLSNSIYFEYPGVGHAASTSGECPLSMTLAFLNDPTAPLNGSCIETMGAPEFQSSTAASQEEISLVEFEADSGFGAIIGVRPDGWQEQFAGVFARGSNALDQTALMQIGAPGIPPDTFLGLVTEQMGLEEGLEEAGQIEDANGRLWDILQGDLQGFPMTIALLNEDSFTFIVLLVSDESDVEALTSSVFLPALDAIQQK
ncbi:MAG: alpha/beta fold hydrolase [Chloroflexota bacterium]